ncbi:MAG: DNA internalization-related competence protein ComEC/Rec2 [Gemmatimonadetes bacterium]|nr:DNA internalization-related competence protein ComEC/Rec2 [Gemmatimonadota bacterium]
MAFATGAALAQIPGAPHLPGPLLLFLALPPILVSRSPVRERALPLLVAAGALAGASTVSTRACPPAPTEPGPVALVGRFLASAPLGEPGSRATSRAVPFVVDGLEGCSPQRVVAPGPVDVGKPSRVTGMWHPNRRGATLVARRVEPLPPQRGSVATIRWLPVRWRGILAKKVEELYGDRAPLVSALILARREGLDPDLRDAFARAGTAHLLAISGFHVGVVAALLTALLGAAGLSRRRTGVAAALGAWGYVALLGFPDAACRAALILILVSLSRAGGRVPARWGALGSALLLMLATGPRRLAGPGFQLSFAGAAGLVAWAPRVRAALRRALGPRAPRGVVAGLAAGIAATLATLPVVAWHFERISLVGIPATMIASPLVALAIPGALASVAAGVVHPGAGHLVATLVVPILSLLEASTCLMAGPEWASVWVPRSWIPVGAGGAAAGLFLLARASRVRRRIRLGVAAAASMGAVAAWPLLLTLQARGSMEIDMLDVGQGDAFAIRTPGNRWLLVDAGPAATSDDPGANGVVRALRRRGVHRLEALVLTHPDMDHIGGSKAVLASLGVGAVIEPSRPTAKEGYVGALEVARAHGVPWMQAHDGEHFTVDGVEFDMLSPPLPGSPGDTLRGGSTDTNVESVVMAVHYGAFDALFTGDAPTFVERAVAARLGEAVEVLKVSHHGSDTGTDPLLLMRASPELALVSVGRGNRYGHPSPLVLARLRAAGVEIRRTDQDGPVRIVARADGRFQVRSRGR